MHITLLSSVTEFGRTTPESWSNEPQPTGDRETINRHQFVQHFLFLIPTQAANPLLCLSATWY